MCAQSWKIFVIVLCPASSCAGNRTSTTDRLARRKDFAYDALDRMTEEAWIPIGGGAATNRVTFTYDGISNLLTAKDDDGTYTLTYDALDRIETQKDLWGKTLTFSYDAVSNRTLLQDSDAGYTTSTYDGLDRLTGRQFSNGTTPLRIDFTYTARDQMESTTRYSDLAATTKVGSSLYTYDSTARLENLKHRNSSDTVLANYTYTYDLADKVKTEVRNGTTVTLAYDATDQLTDDTNTAYSYDLNGNRTMTGYATGTGNRMSNDGVFTYTYDAEGNTIKKSQGPLAETWTFSYDHDNHLIGTEKRATDGGLLQMQATYMYDALSQRVQSVVDADGAGGGSAVTTRFAYDFAKGSLADVYAELDGSSSLTTRYVHGDTVDNPLAKMVGTTVSWLLADRQGSIREIANHTTGAFTYEVTLNGFGKTTAEVNTANSDTYKYNAYRFEAELSMYFVRARYYDPSTGKWTTEDPIGLVDDDNPFGYVKNNATNFKDPTGTRAQGGCEQPRATWAGSRIGIGTGPFTPGGINLANVLASYASATKTYTMMLLFRWNIGYWTSARFSQSFVSLMSSDTRERLELITRGTYKHAIGSRLHKGLQVSPQLVGQHGLLHVSAPANVPWGPADDQRRLIRGIPPRARHPNDKRGTCGPDVTRWFARDLVDHIAYFLKKSAEINKFWDDVAKYRSRDFLDQARTFDLLGAFKDQALMMVYKWMRFGSCATEDCVNTVWLCTKCIRKNQLGNISFGLLVNISNLMSPRRAVEYAYNLPGGGTYSEDHPYSRNYGPYRGLQRADNLAAFGVGNAIAEAIKQLPGMAQLRKELQKANLSDIESIVKKNLSVDDIQKIICDLLKNPTALQQAINTFRDVLKVEKDIPFGVDALTTVPEWLGFNTEECEKCGEVWNGPGTIQVSQALAAGYQRSTGKDPHKGRGARDEYDKWLKSYFENYSKAQGFRPPQP